MKPTLKIVCVLANLCLSAVPLALCAEAAVETPVVKATPDERRRKYEALKKELEAFKPAPDAGDEELLAYFQQMISLSTNFAKKNPQTAEGFEAAFNAAIQLAAKQNAGTGDMAQVAVDAAPQAGVDQRQMATCWVLVAYGKLLKNDAAGASVALEKVKPLDPDLYERAKQQLDAFKAQRAKP